MAPVNWCMPIKPDSGENFHLSNPIHTHTYTPESLLNTARYVYVFLCIFLSYLLFVCLPFHAGIRIYMDVAIRRVVRMINHMQVNTTTTTLTFHIHIHALEFTIFNTNFILYDKHLHISQTKYRIRIILLCIGIPSN